MSGDSKNTVITVEMHIEKYQDRCYTLGSLFVGATGGGAVGYLTKIFDPNATVDKLTISMNSDTLKKAAQKHEAVKKLTHLQLGGNIYWRIGSQVVGSMFLYSFLECKFIGGWTRRSIFDVAFAGGITGGILGLRGIPGGKIGALAGAGGFAAYASLVHLLFR